MQAGLFYQSPREIVVQLRKINRVDGPSRSEGREVSRLEVVGHNMSVRGQDALGYAEHLLGGEESGAPTSDVEDSRRGVFIDDVS